MYNVSVNYWAVLVSGIAFMVIGFLWYGPIFGAAWMKAMGKSKDEMSMQVMPLVWTFIATLVTSYVLAHVLKLIGVATYTDALVTAFWMWLGFTAATVFVNSIYEGTPSFRVWLFLGCELVSFLVAAAILFAWQ